MNLAVQVARRRQHISELVDPGDYCFANANGRKVTLMNCPVCGVRYECEHTILCEEPLSLWPSVMMKLACPSEHHFHVTDGKFHF